LLRLRPPRSSFTLASPDNVASCIYFPLFLPAEFSNRTAPSSSGQFSFFFFLLSPLVYTSTFPPPEKIPSGYTPRTPLILSRCRSPPSRHIYTMAPPPSCPLKRHQNLPPLRLPVNGFGFVTILLAGDLGSRPSVFQRSYLNLARLNSRVDHQPSRKTSPFAYRPPPHGSKMFPLNSPPHLPLTPSANLPGGSPYGAD